MNLKAYNILIFITLCFVGFGQNTDIAFKHLTVEDGLSDLTISCVLQDHKGFMWFATQEGLNRYDGYQIVKYSNVPGDSTSLSGIWVETIFEDADSNLWIGTSNGLNLYNRDTDNFTCFFTDTTNDNSLSNNHIRCVVEENNCLWIATIGGGVNCFNKQTQEITNYNTTSDALSSDIVWSIYKDSNNRLWFGTINGGLKLFSKETGDFQTFVFNHQNLAINSIRCIYEVADNEFLLGTDAGLLRFFADRREGENFFLYKHDENDNNSISKGHVRKIFKDNTGTLWVAAQYGLDIYMPKHDKFTHLEVDKNNAYSLSVHEIWDIVEDNQGSLWFGTFKGGVNVFNKQNGFRNGKFDSENNSELINKSVLSFEEMADSTLWVGIDHWGLSKLDRQKRVLKTYTHNPQRLNSLASNANTSLFIDSKEQLWIGSWAGGLIKLDETSQKFVAHIPPELDINNLHVWGILEDYKGRIWAASHGEGVICYNPQTKDYTTYVNDPDNKNSLDNNQAWAIYEDNQNEIWVGTTTGLNKYNEADSSFTYFPYISSSNTRLNSYKVFSIFEDSGSRLWIGTGGVGLNLFNRETQTFTAFTQEHGLANNTINAIEEDNSGNLWVSSNNGISKVRIALSDSIISVNNFDNLSGLHTSQFNIGASLKSITGEIYFGGNNGYVSFYPDSIRTNMHKPKVYLTDFQIFNKRVPIDPEGKTDSPLRKHILETKEITLTHEQTVFSLQFAALSYIASQKNSYAYRLNGFEDEWNYVNDRREVTYTNLDPGSYVFQVKAANSDGLWNNEPTELAIVILPPWWKTIWFRAFVFAVIVALVLALYFYRISQMVKRQLVLEKQIESRTSELKKANDVLTKQQKELYDLNDQLIDQKDEMEATLIKLKDAQSQLVLSEKMASLGILTAGMAHEINNPLNYIMGGKVAIEKLIEERDAEKISDYKPFVKMIDDGIDKVGHILQSLFSFNQQNYKKNEVCDIHSVIDNCLVVIQSQLKADTVVKKQYTEEPFTLKGSEAELHQVILNVLTNANQAICVNGLITIHTEVNDVLLLRISDTGCGINPENLTKVTDPFYTTKDPGEGTGLGMSISYSIIKQHGGSITYTSEVGKGTTVHITFPIEK